MYICMSVCTHSLHTDDGIVEQKQKIEIIKIIKKNTLGKVIFKSRTLG